jgi:signal peptidase II
MANGKKFRILLIVLILVICIGCDQAVKAYAVKELSLTASASYLGGFVWFQFAENPGYFLSFGSSLPLIVRTWAAITMAILTVLACAILCMVSNRIRMSQLIAWSLLIAGSCGNVIDRLFHHGFVIDFMIIGTSTFHTGIFNIADLLITAGIVYLLGDELLQKRINQPSPPASL